jgi:hypothetical protein
MFKSDLNGTMETSVSYTPRMISAKSYEIYLLMIKIKVLNLPCDVYRWKDELTDSIKGYENIEDANGKISYEYLHESFWMRDVDIKNIIEHVFKYEYNGVEILRNDYDQLHSEIYNEINNMLKDISNNRFIMSNDYIRRR